jgi:DNA-binding CsgD family transcriptional regulator
VPTLTALRLTRESERPLSFGDIRTALGGKGEGLLLGEDLQTNGLLLCAPARSKSFWYLKFEGCMGDVDGAARAVLHVAGELARWRLEEFSHSTSAAIPLTARERQVMRLLSWGKTDSEAAQELKISARTVRFHVDNAKRKLGVASRAQAIVLSLRGRQSTARLGDDAESWPARRQGGVE